MSKPIRRMGYNFRPDWDKSIRQPWFGWCWVWLGPYMIGWPCDFEKRMHIRFSTTSEATRQRIALVLYREMAEHDYEDDEEKRMQVAYHLADKVIQAFTI